MILTDRQRFLDDKHRLPLCKYSLLAAASPFMASAIIRASIIIRHFAAITESTRTTSNLCDLPPESSPSDFFLVQQSTCTVSCPSCGAVYALQLPSAASRLFAANPAAKCVERDARP